MSESPENRLPEVLSSTTPYDDGWVKFNRDELRFSDGSEGPRVWMEFPFVCSIVPVLPSGDIVFVEVYCHPRKALDVGVAGRSWRRGRISGSIGSTGVEGRDRS